MLQLCEEGVDHLFVWMFSIYFGMSSELLVRNDLRLLAQHTMHILPHTKDFTGFHTQLGIKIQDVLTTLKAKGVGFPSLTPWDPLSQNRNKCLHKYHRHVCCIHALVVKDPQS